MYENYSYEQVKALPDHQKIEALKELREIYPDNKTLAEHWSVIPIVPANMIAKYLEGKQVGRKKMTEEEKAQKKLEKQKQLEFEKQKIQEAENGANEEKKETELDNTATSVTNTPPIVKTPIIANAFGITLSKTLSGEEAIKRFNGIANSLLGECEYKIEVSIEEV